ncbi:MAG: sugar phosphate isomerase/epimerase [Phycisphaerae bacterium]|nr:sugar phosphate isomerase/epimerase [Phycisphaerae bacterium]
MKSIDGNLTRRDFVRAAGVVAAASACGLSPAYAAEKIKKPCWDMKLATSSVMFDKLKIEDICKISQNIGLDALDIWGPFKYYETKCDHLEDVKKRLGGKGLRELMTKHKLEVAAFTLYQNCRFSDYWEMIRDYGGGVIVRSDRARASKPEDMTKNMKAFFEGLKPEIELAEKSNSIIAIENHGGGLLNPIDSFKAFVELNPNPKRVGIAFAPYHLQGYKKINISMTDFIKVAGPQIKFFYGWQRGTQKDSFGVNQLPGFGPVDFTPWLQSLADAKYSQYLSIFLHGHGPTDETQANVSKSRDYLLNCRKKVTPGICNKVNMR